MKGKNSNTGVTTGADGSPVEMMKSRGASIVEDSVIYSEGAPGLAAPAMQSSGYLGKFWNLIGYGSGATSSNTLTDKESPVVVDTAKQGQVEERIENSRFINAANSVQNAVTAYPSLQHVTSKILGIQLPTIPKVFMISAHITAAAIQQGYVASAYDNLELAIDRKVVFAKILPTVVYLAKLGISEILIKPMIDSHLVPKNAGQLCAAHGFTQFGVDGLGDAALSLVTAKGNPTSMLYGTAYTAVNCVGNNVELTGWAKTASSAVSVITGALVFYYSHQTLAPDYTKFHVINNVIKAISGTAVANAVFDTLYTAATMSGGYFQSDAPAVCVAGQVGDCVAGNHTAIEAA